MFYLLSVLFCCTVIMRVTTSPPMPLSLDALCGAFHIRSLGIIISGLALVLQLLTLPQYTFSQEFGKNAEAGNYLGTGMLLPLLFLMFGGNHSLCSCWDALPHRCVASVCLCRCFVRKVSVKMGTPAPKNSFGMFTGTQCG